MSRKANLLTIQQPHLATLGLLQNAHQILKVYLLKKKIIQLFKKNYCILDYLNLYSKTNKSILSFNIYLTITKQKFYLKKCKIIKTPSSNQFLPFVHSLLRPIAKHTLTINSILLNPRINIKIQNVLNKRLRIFRRLLFTKRLTLYYDFLNITVLFLQNYLGLNAFMTYLAMIFRRLLKRRHNAFLLFLTQLFTLFTEFYRIYPEIQIKGVKCFCSGRLAGKTRSKSHRIAVGSVPLNTLTKEITYNLIHIFTIYGTFGLKIWLHKTSKK